MSMNIFEGIQATKNKKRYHQLSVNAIAIKGKNSEVIPRNAKIRENNIAIISLVILILYKSPYYLASPIF